MNIEDVQTEYGVRGPMAKIDAPVPLKDARVVSRFDIARDLLKNEFRDAIITHLDNGVFKIDMLAITAIGSAVTQYFTIPFMHRLLRVEVKHTDSAYVDCTDALTYSLKYGSTSKNSLLFAVAAKSATAVTDNAHIFSEFWRSMTRYQLVTNTTNTDLIYVSLLIRLTDNPKRE